MILLLSALLGQFHSVCGLQKSAEIKFGVIHQLCLSLTNLSKATIFLQGDCQANKSTKDQDKICMIKRQ